MPLPWAGAQDDPQNVGESAQAPPTDNDAMLTINIVAIEGDQRDPNQTQNNQRNVGQKLAGGEGSQPRRNDTQFTIVARQ